MKEICFGSIKTEKHWSSRKNTLATRSFEMSRQLTPAFMSMCLKCEGR